MRRFASIVFIFYVVAILSGCNGSSSSSSTATDTSAVKTDSVVASPGSTAGFKLGVQMWTFRMFSFSDALDKVDSAGIKNIEAFMDQNLGGKMSGKFGFNMSQATREQVK